MRTDVKYLDPASEDIVGQTNIHLPYPFQLFDPVSGESDSEYIFSFTLPQLSQMELTLHTTDGTRIETIIDGLIEPDFYSITYDLSHLPNGIYVCILSTPIFNIGAKLILRVNS